MRDKIHNLETAEEATRVAARVMAGSAGTWEMRLLLTNLTHDSHPKPILSWGDFEENTTSPRELNDLINLILRELKTRPI